VSRIPSTTQQSSVPSPKPTTSTAQTGKGLEPFHFVSVVFCSHFITERKPNKRKVEPIVWDKGNTGSQGGIVLSFYLLVISCLICFTASGIGRDVKIKRGEPTRRGT